MVTSKIVNSNLIYSKIADLLCLYVISAHYKIELYDSRSGGFAPPSLGKWKVSQINYRNCNSDNNYENEFINLQ